MGGGGSYFIGLKRNGLSWIWPNNTVAYYTNWRPSQPDGCCGGDVNCVLANYDNDIGQWDDTGCNFLASNQQGFVCEKPVQTTKRMR